MVLPGGFFPSAPGVLPNDRKRYAGMKRIGWFLSLIFGILLAYLAAVLLRLSQAGNVLSATVAFTAAGILLAAQGHMGRADRRFRLVFLLGGCACVCWGIADAVWFFQAWLGETPAGDRATLLLYSLTNLFLFGAVIHGTISQKGKWDRVQFGLDLLISLLVCAQFFWTLLFDKNLQIIQNWIAEDYTSIVSIALDMLIVCAAVLWRLTVRSGPVPKYMRIFIASALAYAALDLWYFTLSMKGLYSPNSLLDFGYSVTLAALAGSALLYGRSGAALPEPEPESALKRKTAYLLAFPVLTMVLYAAGIIRVEPDFDDYAHFAVLIAVHWALSKYLQISTENEGLLRAEKQRNDLLRQEIADQQERLLSMENTDPLTQMGNRKFFLEQLGARLKQDGGSVAVLGVNIDRLRAVNEAYGHDAGDKTLIAFAERLKDWNTQEAVLARISGDEFGMILPKGESVEYASRYADEIVRLCEEPFRFGGISVKVTLSVGIAASDPSVADADSLMECTSAAIRQAKLYGYNKRQVYTDALKSDRKAIMIEQMLKKSRVEKDFSLHYQPQFTIPDHRLIGAEALIRWNCKGIGPVPPDVFIPLAEEIGMIGEIGQWVIREAMEQSVKWNYSRADALKIGVNLSLDQLENERFVPMFRDGMKQTGIRCQWLDVEITESKLLRNSPNILAAFSAFSELGVTVSIDDFGAGYAAIGNLSRFHFDRIKLDRSIVEGLSYGNATSKRIVSSIIEMAHALNMTVIAEGVETGEQLDILRQLGCEQVQGYLYGRPVPAEEFERSYLR